MAFYFCKETPLKQLQTRVLSEKTLIKKKIKWALLRLLKY